MRCWSVMRTKHSPEAINAVIRSAAAFKAFQEAVDKVEANIEELDPYWMMQYAILAHTHYVQGRAYYTSARECRISDEALSLAAGGDVAELERLLL